MVKRRWVVNFFLILLRILFGILIIVVMFLDRGLGGLILIFSFVKDVVDVMVVIVKVLLCVSDLIRFGG